MRRFIAIFALGAVVAAAGQVGLSLGAHPDHAASLTALVRSCLGLVAGTAAMAAGLLGMSDGYETAARKLHGLLGSRRIDAPAELPVGNPAGLASCNASFWKAYRGAALSVCLFLAGLFGLSVGLGNLGYLAYLVAVATGIAVFGTWGVVLCARSLRGAHATCRRVAETGQILEQQPERPATPTPPSKPQVAWNVRRPSSGGYTRHLDRRKPPRQ
ncbi:MAG: hypothetical protein AB1505_15370 [Candidatus Latescibacterota bacterium]